MIAPTTTRCIVRSTIRACGPVSLVDLRLDPLGEQVLSPSATVSVNSVRYEPWMKPGSVCDLVKRAGVALRLVWVPSDEERLAHTLLEPFVWQPLTAQLLAAADAELAAGGLPGRAAVVDGLFITYEPPS